MADPLSIAASTIAILGAASTTGTAVRKLLALRKAPEELQALFEEAEALQGLLRLVQLSLRRLHGTQAYEDVREPFEPLIRTAEQSANELNMLIEYQLKRNEDLDQLGRPKVDRSQWLKSGPDVERIRRKIRDSIDKLNLGMNALNTLQLSSHGVEMGRNVRQLVVQVQSLELTNERGSHHVLAAIESSKHLVSPDNELPLPNTEQSSASETTHDMAEETQDLVPAADKSLRALSTDHRMRSSTLRLTTTVAYERCPRSCGCQCHIRSQGQTPAWLKNVLGSLMFNYSPVVFTKPCNRAWCVRSSRKAHFVYHFPAWMAARALVVHGQWADLRGEGASWSIRMPIITDMLRPWLMVLSGNVAHIQDMISNKTVTPAMMCMLGDQSRGIALLEYAFNYGRFGVIECLLENGFSMTLERDLYDWKTVALYQLMSERNAFQLESEVIGDLLGFSELHHYVVFQPNDRPLPPDFAQRYPDAVNQQDCKGRTPLHWACQKGRGPDVALLLAWAAYSNIQDLEGNTPLHLACWSDNLAVVLILLEAGAKVNVTNDSGHPGFFLTDNVEVVRALLEWGCNPNHQDNVGNTYLHAWAQNDRCSFDMIALLQDYNVDLHAVNNFGEDAVHHSIRFGSTESLAALRKVYTALEEGQQGIRDSYGWNYLHFASLFALPDIMLELARFDLHGHDPRARDNCGNTPDDCFYHYRDYFCAQVRPPFEEEEKAWRALKKSAYEQNGYDADVELAKDDEEWGRIIATDDDESDDDDGSQPDDAFEDTQETFSGD